MTVRLCVRYFYRQWWSRRWGGVAVGAGPSRLGLEVSGSQMASCAAERGKRRAYPNKLISTISACFPPTDPRSAPKVWLHCDCDLDDDSQGLGGVMSSCFWAPRICDHEAGGKNRKHSFCDGVYSHSWKIFTRTLKLRLCGLMILCLSSGENR